MRTMIAWTMSVAFTMWTGSALALEQDTPLTAGASSSSEPPGDIAPPETMSHGALTHDGFYMHADAGVGYYSLSIDDADTTMSGLSKSFSFLLGGSPMPGLVVGGGFGLDHISSPTVTVGGNEISTGDLSQMVIRIGPFVDYYLDPYDGLHFMGMIGWGGVETSSNGNVGGSDPTGLILTVGAGYDFWVADEWSVGVLGRFSYGFFSHNDVSAPTISPALVAAINYH